MGKTLILVGDDGKELTFKPPSSGRNTTKIFIPISVGQNYHEGQYFKNYLSELFSFANDSKTSASILFADTLQRWRYLATSDTSMQKAINRSEQEGTKYLNRNHETLDYYQKQHSIDIIYWQDVLDSNEYPARHKTIKNHYTGNPDSEFSKAIDGLTDIFAQKYKEESLNEFGDLITLGEETHEFNDEFIKHCAREYILEETAVVAVLSLDRGYSIEVYPIVKSEYSLIKKSIPEIFNEGAPLTCISVKEVGAHKQKPVKDWTECLKSLDDISNLRQLSQSPFRVPAATALNALCQLRDSGLPIDTYFSLLSALLAMGVKGQEIPNTDKILRLDHWRNIMGAEVTFSKPKLAEPAPRRPPATSPTY